MKVTILNPKIKTYIEKLKYSQPIFVYDLEKIGEQVGKIQKAFASYPNFELLYAVKANNNPKILVYLAKLGLGFHVSTLAEMKLAKKFSNNISFTGPILRLEELFFMKRHKIRVNANSLRDLEKVKDMKDIGIRINPELGWSLNKEHIAGGFGSQFGVTLRELENNSTIKEVGIKTLHMHTSSDSYNIEIFVNSLKHLLEIASKFPSVDAINVGGGIAAATSSLPEFKIEEYARKTINLVLQFNHKYKRNLRIEMEPGSYIVRQAGFYVCKIYSKIQKKDGLYYYSDGTIHHLRGLVNNRSLLTLKNIRSFVKGSIFGCTCQRGDVLFRKGKLPQLEENDFIAIPNVGAYCSVQADNFNMVRKPKESVIY